MIKKAMKVGLIVGLISGLSGCFKDKTTEKDKIIENVKKEKLTIKKVSSYTFQQLAEKLDNVEWTKKMGKKYKNGLQEVDVDLNGSMLVNPPDNKKLKFLIYLNIDAGYVLNPDKSINKIYGGSISYSVNWIAKEKNSGKLYGNEKLYYVNTPLGELCKGSKSKIGSYKRRLKSDECISEVNYLFSEVIFKKNNNDVKQN